MEIYDINLGILNNYAGSKVKTSSFSHNKPRPMHHCKVLPLGEFNSIIPVQLLLICHESS